MAVARSRESFHKLFRGQWGTFNPPERLDRYFVILDGEETGLESCR